MSMAFLSEKIHRKEVKHSFKILRVALVEAMKPSAYMGTKVGGGASGATSQLTSTSQNAIEDQ